MCLVYSFAHGRFSVNLCSFQETGYMANKQHNEGIFSHLSRTGFLSVGTVNVPGWVILVGAVWAREHPWFLPTRCQ